MEFKLSEQESNYWSSQLDDWETASAEYFLEYLKKYGSTSTEDFDALESEITIIFKSLKIAFETKQWLMVIEYGKHLFPNENNMLLIRGRYSNKLAEYINQIIIACQTLKETAVFFPDEFYSHLRWELFFKLKLTEVQMHSTRSSLQVKPLIISSLNQLKDLEHRDFKLLKVVFLNKLALLEENSENYQEALNSLHEMLSIAWTIGMEARVMPDYFSKVARIAKFMDIDSRERYYLKSIEFADQQNNKILLCMTLSELGDFYFNEKNDLDAAAKVYHRSLDITREYNYIDRISRNLNGLANIEIINQNYSAAEALIKESLSFSEMNADTYNQKISYDLLNRIYQLK